MKPLLKVVDGRIGSFEKVRTAGKALQRLEELAVEAAGDRPVDVAVAHLASPDRRPALADAAGRAAGRAASTAARCPWARSGPCSAPTSAPGMVAVVVAPRD